MKLFCRTSFRIARFSVAGLPTIIAALLLSFSPGQAQTHRDGDWFEVRIDSGPFAGRHYVGGEMNCSFTDVNGGIWLADVTLDRPTGLTNVLVMLTGVSAEGGKTQQADLGLTFGQIHDTTPGRVGQLGIGGASGGGSGVGTVERRGHGAVIRIEGSTHYGAKLSAVVDCKSFQL